MKSAALQKAKRKRGRPPRAFYPLAPERAYQRRLKKLADTLQRLTEEILIPRLNLINKEVEASRLDSRKVDAVTPDEIDAVVGQILIEFNRRYSERARKEIIEQAERETLAFSTRQVQRIVSSQIGREFVFGVEPYLTQEVLLFQSFNSNLIKSIPERYSTELTNRLLAGLTAGSSTTDISKSIRELYPITRRRADLIARDQIGKFAASIDEVRYRNLGIEKYIWRTQQDDRVRPEHAELEGKVRTWDESPLPGEEISCRCYSEPVFEDAQ